MVNDKILKEIQEKRAVELWLAPILQRIKETNDEICSSNSRLTPTHNDEIDRAKCVIKEKKKQ